MFINFHIYICIYIYILSNKYIESNSNSISFSNLDTNSLTNLHSMYVRTYFVCYIQICVYM